MRRNTLIIFTIIALLFIPVFDMNTVSAAENEISDYEYDFVSFKEKLISFLDEYNSYSSETLEGKVSLLEPTYLIEYSPNEDKYSHRKALYQIIMPVKCDNRIIAVVYVDIHTKKASPSTIIHVSQNIDSDINNGISIFKSVDMVVDDDFYGGVYESNFFMIDSTDKVCLSYYKVFYDKATLEDRILSENNRSTMKQKPTFKYISTLYHINSATRTLYSFDYSYNGTSFIKNGGEYYIQNKNGKYLTYIDGKYTLSDNNKTAFIIKRNDDNTFSFSPENAPDKKISVKGTNKFLINLSYFDGYCYSICKSNDHSSYMRAKGDRVAFTKGEPDKVWDASRDWYLVCA